MTQNFVKIAFLSHDRRRLTYNNKLKSRLLKSGIEYKSVVKKFGTAIMVDEKDAEKAYMVILAIPQY